MIYSKQETARMRNWTKARVIGIAAGMSYSATVGILTPEEGVVIAQINSLKKKLLDEWETNSTKLGMKVKKKHE